MKKHEIRVTIDSTKKQQRAIEILNKHGEKIGKSKLAMVFNDSCRNLVFSLGFKFWRVTSIDDEKTEITLEQLDELLINSK